MPHTPGPWVRMAIDDTAVTDIDSEPSTRGDKLCGRIICICGKDAYVNPFVQIENREEARANAILIAAAPDLLQAAKSALIGLENGKGSVPFIITILRAAVVKAEKGES